MDNDYLFTSGGFTVKSLDEIREVAPAVFAEDNHPVVSDKYKRVSTVGMIKSLDKVGWKPISAKQIGEGKWGRHVIRFVQKKNKLEFKVDDVLAQLILDNSFDGTSLGNISAGVFRKACANGMTVGIPGLTTNYSFRHLGDHDQEIKEMVEKAINDFGTIEEHIAMMQDTPLEDKIKLDFALKAVSERDLHLYINEKGKLDKRKVKKMNDLDKLILPVRDQDKGDDLWRTFNVIQEKLVKGGYRRISEKGRKVSVPGIANPVRNVAFNRDLWNLAETYLK